MAVTLHTHDYINRSLVNQTPGVSAATDYLGRAVVAAPPNDTDYLGRLLVTP